jgi:hypothetical protein
MENLRICECALNYKVNKHFTSYPFLYSLRCPPSLLNSITRYYALGLNDDCTEEVPKPSFTTADRVPVPKFFPPNTVTNDVANDHSSFTSYYVDYAMGVDSNSGSLDNPFKTIQAAVNAAANKPSATINLRHGTHYVSAPVHISTANQGLTIQNFHGETVVVSGAVLLQPVWKDFDLPSGIASNAYVADVSAAGLVTRGLANPPNGEGRSEAYLGVRENAKLGLANGP